MALLSSPRAHAPEIEEQVPATFWELPAMTMVGSLCLPGLLLQWGRETPPCSSLLRRQRLEPWPEDPPCEHRQGVLSEST